MSSGTGIFDAVVGWADLPPDDDGFVHLTGRAKDLIVRGGHNIDPAVIEDALLAHPAVTDAQAVSRPDLHSGEVPVVIVGAGPVGVSAATLQNHPEGWRSPTSEPRCAPRMHEPMAAPPSYSPARGYQAGN
ncbi:hypothetical protein GCM10009844_20510 [Nocardioides koreensis]|uniref:AMP-binding enzyme C-terminal domain-containing protein n=1 Tax=Nocardioides koreensis TaxID=433651 RepID=A0ABN2ZPK2_9ACTN